MYGIDRYYLENCSQSSMMNRVDWPIMSRIQPAMEHFLPFHRFIGTHRWGVCCVCVCVFVFDTRNKSERVISAVKKVGCAKSILYSNALVYDERYE